MLVNFFKISKILLYLAPFAVIIVTPSTLFPFIVGKYTFFKVIVELALMFAILGWGFEEKVSGIRYQVSGLFQNPLFIAVSFFVAIFTLAGFTGINPSGSFWSNFERGEGSFLMLHFYLFFVLLLLFLKSEKDWKNLFRVSVFAGILVMFYGMAGAFKLEGFVSVPFCDRFAGSLGNPAYIGTYTIFVLFYVGSLIASGDWRSKIWQRWNLPFLILLGLYFFVFLTFSQTRGGFLGLGVGVIAALFYLAFSMPQKFWRRAALLTAVALIALGSLGVYYRQYINLAPWCAEGGNRILDVSFGGATIGTRFVLWQQSIEAWKERPLLGWGPENFSIAFEKYYNPIHTVWFDRAHNIFFDYLIFGGILGLLSFVAMFAVFYAQFFTATGWQKLKQKDENLKKNQYQNEKQNIATMLTNTQFTVQRAIIFALPLGYLIQGLVLFDVLPIYINLFLFLAFANYKFGTRS
ncbi:MAG: O-antigen ligase family protein [Candidatus Liptonbacteria bacterium]|nr:O-antigen ligase family protein [Candidatus Liptonbacteria bacterium]